MKNEKRTEYVTRDTILRMLSDVEIARVSSAETAAALAEGDEYVDLEHPDRGIRRAQASATTAMGSVLPRKAVDGKTWRDVVILLASHQVPRHAHH